MLAHNSGQKRKATKGAKKGMERCLLGLSTQEQVIGSMGVLLSTEQRTHKKLAIQISRFHNT